MLPKYYRKGDFWSRLGKVINNVDSLQPKYYRKKTTENRHFRDTSYMTEISVVNFFGSFSVVVLLNSKSRNLLPKL